MIQRKTFHAVDPSLTNSGGHYLSQHIALWTLCKKMNFNFISYCKDSFPVEELPSGMVVKKIFPQSLNALNGHYLLTIANNNNAAYEGLCQIDIDSLGEDDIVFLLSVGPLSGLAYAKWLSTVLPKTKANFGLYAALSTNVDDTYARQFRRNGIAIDDKAFDVLDRFGVANDLYRSIYHRLFESIPDKYISRCAVFHPEYYLNKTFSNLCRHDDMRFIYIHSMYPGGELNEYNPPGNEIKISFLGSGGIDSYSKGRRFLADIVANITPKFPQTKFIFHFGNMHLTGVDKELQSQLTILEDNPQVQCFKGFLKWDKYCELLEGSDIVLLPYGPAYRRILSGVFDESLFLAKVAVIPELSSMNEWMVQNSLKAPTFFHWNAESIANALAKAIEDLSFYRSQFADAQIICRNRWKNFNPITVLSKDKESSYE